MLGNRDFAERTGLPKATVNRLAYTLTVLGYLRYDDALGKYALDAGVLSLGYALLAGSDTLALARPHMQALAREIGAAVSLGCRDGLDMIYLETIRSETALTLGLASGSRLSMLTSSMGRAYLAVQPPTRARRSSPSCARRWGRGGRGRRSSTRRGARPMRSRPTAAAIRLATGTAT